MIKFPLKFEVKAKAESKTDTLWDSSANSNPPIRLCIPPEFGGPGGAYCPEDLFALSIINCIIATFKVYAEKSNVSYQTIEAQATLSVDKNPSENFLMMSHIEVKINVTGAQDIEKIKMLLDKAIKECAISNSIKTGKSFQINVS